MQNTVLRFGLISGVLLVALGWLSYLITKPMGYTASEVGGYVGIIVSLLLVYFGVKYHRDHKCGGYISFGRGFTVGLLITLFPSIFMFFSTVVFFATQGDKWTQWALESMPPDKVEAFEANLDHPLYTNLAFQGFIMFMTVFFIGLIIAAISALILQRKATG